MTDDLGLSATTSRSITIAPATGPQPPIADAGEDASYVAGDRVSLDGSLSMDNDGEIRSYEWRQTGGNPVVTLMNANESVASFVAPAVAAEATLQFTLTVMDDDSQVDSASVSIRIDPEDDGTGMGAWNPIVTDDDTVTIIANSLIGSRGGMQNLLRMALRDGTPRYDITIDMPDDTDDGFFYATSLAQMYERLTHSHITNGNFDIVVVTNGSVENDLARFYNLIRPTGAYMVIFQTWGWPNNPSQVSRTTFRDRVQAEIELSREFANERSDVFVIPSGYVFHELTVNPIPGATRIDYLFDPRDNHQSALGNLVNAYVAYSALTGRSPVGLDVQHSPYVVLSTEQLSVRAKDPDVPQGDPNQYYMEHYDIAFLRALQSRVWELVQHWKATDGNVILSQSD